jgi:hypothetical protein
MCFRSFRAAKTCSTREQFARDNWLPNRVFKSDDDFVDDCCDAWRNLVEQPWRVMSIGLRQ